MPNEEDGLTDISKYQDPKNMSNLELWNTYHDHGMFDYQVYPEEYYVLLEREADLRGFELWEEDSITPTPPPASIEDKIVTTVRFPEGASKPKVTLGEDALILESSGYRVELPVDWFDRTEPGQVLEITMNMESLTV